MATRWTHAWAAEGALASLRFVFALWLLAFSIGAGSHEHETGEHGGHASVCVLCSIAGSDDGDDLHPAGPGLRLAAPSAEVAPLVAPIAAVVQGQSRARHPVRGPPLLS
ncbi:hypothetical protein [Parvularcula maris]|uniref:DUF2946 domain-containing protein n=1 Tax=Parvularcula maris TaxID=2965077 RepID=A0A9X2L8F6_9PROT|nr:hypothetical protein [Parvularcula maris]MCQ8184087.1 hypothetical protein [Parvularcula maris]